MSWVIALAIGALAAAGVYLLLARHVLRVVVGASLLGSATNLMLFVSGRIGPQRPPVIEEGLDALVDSTNPLPQALVLTAIVIGLALTCFSLVLALGVKQTTGTSDTDDLREAEPPHDAEGKPAVLVDADREGRDGGPPA